MDMFGWKPAPADRPDFRDFQSAPGQPEKGVEQATSVTEGDMHMHKLFLALSAASLGGSGATVSAVHGKGCGPA